MTRNVRATLPFVGLLLTLLTGCASTSQNHQGGVFPCLWSDNGFAFYPFYYHAAHDGGRRESTWMLCGLLGWLDERGRTYSDWFVPAYARGRQWFCSLPYSTFERGRRGVRELYFAGLAGRLTGDDGKTVAHWTAPLYYSGEEGFATLLYGDLAGREWLFPAYYRDGEWSANLAYATRSDEKAQEHSLVIPWLLTWSNWNDRGGSSLYTPLYGWTGGGTSQTNTWWATPLVGTRAGLLTGGWLFPLFDWSECRKIDEKTQTTGADILPADVSLSRDRATDHTGRTASVQIVKGTRKVERKRTYLCLFDDDTELFGRKRESDALYHFVYHRKIGNRFIAEWDERREFAYDVETRLKTGSRETFRTSVLWRLFRYEREASGEVALDILFVPLFW